MNWAKLVVVLVAVQAITSLLAQRAAADNFLGPILAPVADGICHAAYCGMGKCEASFNETFGFACECQDGWSQSHVGEAHFHFLPCVIPNCTINYSCSNQSQPPTPAPAPPPATNSSIFDPCFLAYCGGGSCEKTSDYTHKCVCNQGFSNLMNMTGLPCFRDCSFGGDCKNLGIPMTNAPSNSPPAPSSLSDNSKSSTGGSSISLDKLLELLVLVSFIWTQTTW